MFARGVHWLGNTISLHLWCMVESGNWIWALLTYGYRRPPALGTLLSPALVSVTMCHHTSLFCSSSPLLHSSSFSSTVLFKWVISSKEIKPWNGLVCQKYAFWCTVLHTSGKYRVFGELGQVSPRQDGRAESRKGKGHAKAGFFFLFFSSSYCSNTLSFLYLLLCVTYAFSSFQSYSSIFWPLAFSFFSYFCFSYVTLLLDHSYLTSTLNPRYAKALLWGCMNVWGV